MTVPEFVPTQLIELNGVVLHGKPVLIEEARSQPTQSLNFDARLRNTQNPQNLPPSKVKRTTEELTTYAAETKHQQQLFRCF